MSNQERPVREKPTINKGTLKTAKRLLGYVTSGYKIQFIVVVICILLCSVASISVSLSLKFLLDDFIIPLMGQENPDFSELYMALSVLACIFAAGVVASFLYNRLMVGIGPGGLEKGRGERVEDIRTLPTR